MKWPNLSKFRSETERGGSRSQPVLAAYLWNRLWLLVIAGMSLAGLFDSIAVTAAQETELQPANWDVLRGDSRLAAPRSLDSYFPFAVPTDLATWERRKATLQDRLRTVLGLQPDLPRPALEPVISEPLVLDGYSVSKVRFESMPGFFVTGSLYRPLPKTPAEPGAEESVDRRPAILSPHGHWARGRFMYANDDEVKRQLDSGAETHECGARSPLQARCVHLARMGCVVFHYDMLGNADSVQIPESLAHGYSKRRPHLESADAYGLFSVRAESYFQSIMSLQTWNTIRSLDFLESLPDVDPHRIGVTGASGGGTQTFIACAIDPRPAISFPAVMVGTAMQGGCVCENCSFLRVETGNVEIAAMFAPRPQGLTAADDWTKEMPTKGFPELQQIYDMYGVKDQVELTSRLEFGHNYNQFGRQAMYRLVARNFGLPDFPETPFRVLRDQEMSWFAKVEHEPPTTEGGPPSSEFQPETGETFEVKLLQWWQSVIQQSWSKLQEALIAAGQDQDGQLDKWRTRMCGIYLGHDYQLPTNLRWTTVTAPVPIAAASGWQRSEWLLEDLDRQALVPVVMLEAVGSAVSEPPSADRICVYFGDHADKLLDETGQPQPWVLERLEAGQRVISLDMFGQGRFTSHAGFKMDDRWQMTRRESASYVMGYNLPVVSLRAQDILQVLTAILPPTNGSSPATATMPAVLELVAEGDGVPALSVSALAWDQWAGCKAEVLIDGQSQLRLRRIELRGSDFRFAEVESLRDENFLPGSAVIGDLPGMWMLNRVPNVHVDRVDAAWTRSNQVRIALGAPSLIFQP
ncbi:MAG: acetylxylan esterase [Planctomycetaceae bacterium]|nr:acetylxylan esterase [Planctomycetaceae bacterium]